MTITLSTVRQVALKMSIATSAVLFLLGMYKYTRYKIRNKRHRRNQHRKRLVKINSISFGGGGWRQFYYIGVVKALQELDPDLHEIITYSGCSAGAWACVSMCANIPANDVYQYMYEVCVKKNSETTGLLEKMRMKESCVAYYENYVRSKLPDDAFSRILFSTTQLSSSGVKNKLKTNFRDEKHFFNCLMRSSYIPFIMGDSLVYCHKLYIDGGITMNQPFFQKHNRHHTLIVSVFDDNHRADIYPSEPLSLLHILYPPPPEEAKRMYEMGYRDTLSYFS